MELTTIARVCGKIMYITSIWKIWLHWQWRSQPWRGFPWLVRSECRDEQMGLLEYRSRSGLWMGLFPIIITLFTWCTGSLKGNKRLLYMILWWRFTFWCKFIFCCPISGHMVAQNESDGLYTNMFQKCWLWLFWHILCIWQVAMI